MTLFGIDIAQEIADAMPVGDLPAATLTVRTPGTRDPSDLSAGTYPTTSVYDCRGTISKWTGVVDGTLERRQASEVMLIGKSISNGAITPAPGNRVSIDGSSYTIVSVATGPAGATHVCTVAA